MKQRGRKSEASLEMVASVEPIPRMPPPAQLSEFEAEVWVQITATKPADWFNADTIPLLVSYCKHISHAAVLDDQISAFDPQWMEEADGLKRYRTLLDMREKESRAMTALARSMRLTQQSRYSAPTAETAARKTAAKKPWQS